MAEFQARGVLLRYTDFQESARMVTLLTPEGRVDAAAHGARKSSSPLFAATQLLTYGEYVLQTRGQHTTLRSASLLDGYLPLRSDPDRALHGAYSAALALAIAQPGEDSEALLGLLLSALAYLAYSEKSPAAVTAYFVLRAMDAAGYRPNLALCPYCGAKGPFVRFDPASGEVYCGECARSKNIHPRTVDWMRACLDLEDRPERLLDYEEHAIPALRLLLPYCEKRLDTEIKAGKLLPYA